MSTRLHIVVPDEVVALIDERRGDVPRSRWIMRALARDLQGSHPGFPQPTGDRLDPPRVVPAPSRAPDVEAVKAFADAEVPPKTFKCPKATCPHVQSEPGKCPWHPNLTLIES